MVLCRTTSNLAAAPRVLALIPTDQSPLHPQLLTRGLRTSDVPIEHQRQVRVISRQTALSKWGSGGAV